MVGILNAMLEWDRLPDCGGQNKNQIHGAFYGRKASKVKLDEGFPIYKLHNFAALTKESSPGTPVSEWWAPYNPYEEDPGFTERMKLARHFGTSLREIARVYLAVSEDWNSFQFLALVRLAAPAYGFYGTVAGQARLHAGKDSRRMVGEQRGATSGLAGHGRQIFIPFLTLAHVKDVKVVRIDQIEGGQARMPLRL